MIMINRSFWLNKNVLITGHTGFKGSWLSLWLLELGAKLSGIGLSPKTKPSLFHELEISKKFDNIYTEDIRNSIKIQQLIKKIEPDIVFHLAAQPLVRESYKDPLGTWSTNVMGSLNILYALSELNRQCSVVMVTTDKVYKNKESGSGYKESDELGGFDPYSASKAACEIAINSWRSSFCDVKKTERSNLNIATARAGNVIGGGDWSEDRIMPDAIRALNNNQIIMARNPYSIRPWQHVIEPLAGYLKLAENLYYQDNLKIRELNPFTTSFNFGPNIDSNKKVSELLDDVLIYWPGKWEFKKDSKNLYETKILNLNIEKATNILKWIPKWNFETTIRRTVNWYKAFYQKDKNSYSLCLDDLNYYMNYENLS